METEASLRIKEEIRIALAGTLPGRASQEEMMSAYGKGSAAPFEPRSSAVLVALVAGGPGPSLLLIERTAGGPHGSQIAFPGGKREDGDLSLVETALREAREEIGLDPGSVEVLGLLSPVSVYVSRFLVQPIVGFVAEAPALSPNPDEVASIIEVPLAELLRPGNRQKRAVLARGEVRVVPCYVFGEIIVWGATAMILAEFEQVIRRCLLPGELLTRQLNIT
jgi:8-oxo-dGTP pyrophosphatase MutT (NUDIX family)